MELRIPSSIELEHTNSWCPGCGHGVVARILAEAIEAVGQQENTVLVEDVACGHFQTPILSYNNLNCAHGRTIISAAGLKRAQPGSIVIAHCGDGAAYSIGIESTIHCALRNENILALITNNSVFGMTGGQMSPASLPDQKTSSSPHGRDLDRHGRPFDIVKTMKEYDIAYLARGSVSTPANVIKAARMVKKALEKQMRGEGFCLVELLTQCPTNWNLTPVASLSYMREHLEPFFQLGEFTDKGGNRT